MSTLFTIGAINLDFLCQDIGMRFLTRISMRIGSIRIRKGTMVVSRPMAPGFMAFRNPQALRSQPMAFWCSRKRVYDKPEIEHRSFLKPLVQGRFGHLVDSARSSVPYRKGWACLLGLPLP